MCYYRYSLVLLLSAVLVGAFPARAQVERVFEPGYVVSLAGDTLRGELIDDIDLENTRAVRFRSDSLAVSWGTFNPLNAFTASGDDLDIRGLHVFGVGSYRF